MEPKVSVHIAFTDRAKAAWPQLQTTRFVLEAKQAFPAAPHLQVGDTVRLEGVPAPGLGVAGREWTLMADETSLLILLDVPGPP